VILAGMPVVPAAVLATARLGVINAHNGALPAYRGMDAVGWALLNGDSVTCTVHIARPAVDAGEVIADLGVPPAPAGTLRSRVKDAQVTLLLDAAAFTARHGRLPAAAPQRAGAGRHYYRMHPHLKRLLDASPYASAGNDSEGARAS
jgi:methionyl-tRNA formyltransferase